MIKLKHTKGQLDAPSDLVIFTLIIAVFFTSIYSVFTSYSEIRIELSEKEISRTAIQLTENILSSNLTYKKSIFDKNQLDKYQDTNIEPVKLCSYAYLVEITDLTNNNTWSFGYKDAEGENGATYPVSIRYEDHFAPAEMKIFLKTGNIIKAFCKINGTEAKIPCYNPKGGNVCIFTVTKEGENTCISGKSKKVCRRFGEL
ncbi:MAG: hypothetical protein DRO96_00960 [Candidatus Aenigmatarchaeota archaeon]|nr:MAG: hypothetical protein DRO96_00960 [Candidatus Aenigmarchaeota archaeon]